MRLAGNSETAADIGADHGYLATALIESGAAKYVIAADKNKGPLSAAKKTATAAGLEGKIALRLGDGLDVIKIGEVETICVAGMGGALIARILEKDLPVAKSARRLVLQPNNGANILRRFLYTRGFDVTDEELVKEKGHIYEIIAAKPVEVPLPLPDEITLLLGARILTKNPILLQEHLSNIIRKYRRKLQGLQQGGKTAEAKAANEVIESLKRLLLQKTV